MKNIPPSIRETAFNCPHCHTLTTQYWHNCYVKQLNKDQHPFIINKHNLGDFNFDNVEDEEERQRLYSWVKQAAEGRPFFADFTSQVDSEVTNIWFSKCYNCNEIAVWLVDTLLYPQKGEAPPANADMPEDILRDYNEASAILDKSPRGAAALIRLAIQKLCKELGQPGRNINDDIGALVRLGLDPRVQQALDAVRVIGNNAVHPGSIDLRDDRATAASLFKLLNLVVDKMISEPKHIEEVYASLPEPAKKAIEKRDGQN